MATDGCVRASEFAVVAVGASKAADVAVGMAFDETIDTVGDSEASVVAVVEEAIGTVGDSEAAVVSVVTVAVIRMAVERVSEVSAVDTDSVWAVETVVTVDESSEMIEIVVERTSSMEREALH